MHEADYSWADRVLHRLALGSAAVAELSFDLDQQACGARMRAADAARRHNVFIAGLARAGTTILLHHLHALGCFRSLTYRDMPFPLAPNLWRRFSASWRKAQPAHERAHGDGIIVDADSPEALEQVFWRVHCGADYIRRGGLWPHSPDDDTLRRFTSYVAAILASGAPGQTRYLSKNNNNILRLPALAATFPASTFIVPFRQPAAHALSLWRQHRHFCALQAEQPFVRRYMDWLVHHEFGLGHRPFRMGGGPADHLRPEQPDYWLDLWVKVHETLLAQPVRNRIFVGLDALCGDPATWPLLCQRLELPADGRPAFKALPPPATDAFDPALLRRALTLYEALREAGDEIRAFPNAA